MNTIDACNTCGAAQKHIREALMESEIRQAADRECDRIVELFRLFAEQDGFPDRAERWLRAAEAVEQREHR